MMIVFTEQQINFIDRHICEVAILYPITSKLEDKQLKILLNQLSKF